MGVCPSYGPFSDTSEEKCTLNDEVDFFSMFNDAKRSAFVVYDWETPELPGNCSIPVE